MRPQNCLQAGSFTCFSSLLQKLLDGITPQEYPRLQNPRRNFARLASLAMAPFLIPLAQVDLSAQSPNWYGSPQYGGYAQSPYAPQGGGYGQPAYGQSPYSQPGYTQPYSQPAPQQLYAGQQYAGQPYAAQPSPQESFDYGPPDLGEESDQGYGRQQAPAQAFSAEQLEQMLAPIALYPDALVAQILAAATYPAQVSVADEWLRTMGNAPPQQIAAQADAQNWDPSVKALTAFPQVLAMMNHDLAWTTDVGNAYFNQPQDVLQTMQVLRQRAQAAGTLRNTPQEQMTYDQGNIELAPPDPNVVYVPQYNPWSAYGDPIQPYPGFSLLGAIGSFFNSSIGSNVIQYGLGVAMSAFTSTPFGWLSWALDWLGNSILFNHSAYYSNSPSVARWGGGWEGRGGRGWDRGYRGGYERGFDRGNYRGRDYGRGYGFRGHEYRAGIEERGWGNRGYGREGNGFADNRNRAFGMQPGYAQRPGYENRYGREGFGNNSRSGQSQYAYGRAPERSVMPARPQPMIQRPYSNPGSGRSGYGSGFMSGGSAWGGRSGSYYGGGQQTWRTPAMPKQHSFTSRNEFGRGFGSSHHSFFGGGNSGYKPPKSGGGFHLFGGGGHSSPHFSAPKAPKGFGGGGHGGGGHSGGHGGGGGWGHHH